MNTPKIRFKGFEDDWEQRKFGDYNDLMTGYPFESDKFSEDGIKLVRGMNVKRGYLDFSGDICVKWNSCVGLENFLLKDGDILIQMDGALIGKSYAKIKENQLPALLVQRVTRARTNNKFASQDFMYQTIQRDFLRYIEMNKTETAVPHLSLNDIRNFEIMVPCLAEQKKIGEYFDSLDNLITLHQRKCDETKQLKKFMLQKMFPKNGEKNPEIRFEGFTDDWEQRKLGEVSSKITKKNQDIVVDEVFTNSAEYGIISQRDFFDKDIANFENIDGYYIVEPNDFVYNPRISTTAPFGPIKRNKLERTGAMSPLYYVFRPHDIDLSYLECFFQTSCWHTFMRFNGNTGARSDRFAITDKVFDEMPISMPQDIEEQQKIGSYFSSLDNLITLHQRKCEKLKELKKFMLQNMFV